MNWIIARNIVSLGGCAVLLIGGLCNVTWPNSGFIWVVGAGTAAVLIGELVLRDLAIKQAARDAVHKTWGGRS